jgi:hypothetical protein
MSGSLADAAVLAATAGSGPIEVTGSGALAAEIRAKLGADAAADDVPGTILETTGEIAEIERAFARVRDLGTVVLVVDLEEDAPPVDLYRDVHVRGLTVIGVPDPTA